MADVFTYAALAWLTDILDAQTLYGSWGTGNATASRSDTTLDTEATESRVSATLTRETISQTNDTLVCSFTMTCNATDKTIYNAGVLSASTVGTLILKSNFSGVPVTSGNTIAFVFKLRFK